MFFRKPCVSAEELRARYLSVVLSYVATRVHTDRAAAEDITAEVFGAAFRSLSRCPSPAPVGSEQDPARAWLFGIAHHKIADFYRRRPEEIPIPESLSAPGSPHTSAELAEEARALRQILSLLPALQREVLLLKYVEQLSLAEIAGVLEKSETAVSQLLYRARQGARTHGKAYFCEEETR